MPTAPTDQFAGAEQSVDEQQASALATLAQFGRRGLEEAVAGQKSAEAARSGMEADAARAGGQWGVGASGAKELAALTAGQGAYVDNATQNVALIQRENDAANAVNANYYNQVKEAVPLLRTNAASITDQYRRAYEERQAAAAADAAKLAEQQRQAAIMLAAAQEQNRQEQAIADALYEAQHKTDINNGMLTPEDIAYFNAVAAASKAKFNQGDRPANWRPS